MVKLTKDQKRKKKIKAAQKAARTRMHEDNAALKGISDEEIALTMQLLETAEQEGLPVTFEEAANTARDVVSGKSANMDDWPSERDFQNALEERLSKRLQSTDFETLTVGGSKLRFDMAMAIDGYPFELPEGADPSDYEPLLTNEQYMSDRYDPVIDAVFYRASLGEYQPA
ncbi:hypothetical protein N473_07490 [Pseudoalteromonas luteoviolacea CPMOR-1]|uniref:Uncharacterized protein n=1 Tax=Pseudoalteromonas luteoviolacea CPMOR-1 TaxID=1365248 RepID=A0A161YYD8_9GAMM|nr:hypothetical protein [Pseudoalteromonas luteoviolacea]KZN68260.1 hypothetical protein N473_07490 [Pseudoalteromonas luteoviolacea CPMOR-1]